jgi:hypothetical protein
MVPLYNNDDDFRLFCGMTECLAFLPVPDLNNGIHLLRTLCPDDPPEAAEPYRRMGMSYQVEELAVLALAHVVGSGTTVDCGIMYVPNGWWKHR